MESHAVASEPIWFGPEQRSLFGWIHYPQSLIVRGAVLLCPSLGIEGESSYLAFRELADILSHEDYLVLRFDYEGTGDSANSKDDDSYLYSWLHSIYLATDTLRTTGVHNLSVVGMRMGAMLSAIAQNNRRVFDNMILWDPPLSGRSFLRQQYLLQSQIQAPLFSYQPRNEEIPGMSMTPSTIEELGSLHLSSFNVNNADRILILSRPEQPLPGQIQLALGGRHVSWDVTLGQSELLDVPLLAAHSNQDDVSTIISWIRQNHVSHQLISNNWRSAERPRVVSSSPSILEHTSTLRATRTFFFTTTRTQSSAQTHYPLNIVFLNSGNLHHIGPARQWVTFSRLWAGLGFRCIRLDLPGLGESRDLDDTKTIVYPRTVSSVLSELFSTLGLSPSSVVLVGLCSGADHALTLAAEMNLAGAFAINPSSRSYWKPFRLLRVDRSEPLLSATQSLISSTNPLPALSAHRPLVGTVRSIAHALRNRDSSRHAPVVVQAFAEYAYELLWWFMNTFIQRRHSTDAVRRIIRNGGRVLLIAAPDEANSIRRGERLMQWREKQTGRLDIVILPSLDHNLHVSRGREQVSAIMTEYLLQHFTSQRLE